MIKHGYGYGLLSAEDISSGSSIPKLTIWYHNHTQMDECEHAHALRTNLLSHRHQKPWSLVSSNAALDP